MNEFIVAAEQALDDLRPFRFTFFKVVWTNEFDFKWGLFILVDLVKK